MCPLLNDRALVENKNLIAEFAGGQPVRDINRSLISDYFVKLAVYLSLGNRVKSSGRLV